MNITVVLGAMAVVGAVGLVWWSLVPRTSKARVNLFAGMQHAEPEDPEGVLVTSTRRLGQGTRRLLPNFLVDGLEVKLVQAGNPRNLDLARLMGFKLILGASGAFFGLVLGNVVLVLLFALLGFFFPDYWITSVRDERQQAMRSAASDIVDQLTICVEAGLGFDAALARVATANEGPLAEEFRRALGDIQAGVPRDQALRTMADRAQIKEVRAFVSALLQAQKHGVPLADTLRIQAAEMRDKRKQAIEEKAAKLGTKMIFPIVFCFLPVFFIIILVPAVSGLADAFG